MLLHPVGKIKGVIQFEALKHIKPSTQNNLPTMVRCDVAIMFCTRGVVRPGELNANTVVAAYLEFSRPDMQRLHTVAWLHMNALDVGPPLDLVQMFAGVGSVTAGTHCLI